MNGIELDYSDIADIFKEKLHVDNIVKKISSIFLNSRYFSKIDYKPYFQRNYVWDSEKASYFIESILLGTEIPPLVFFQTKTNTEVIDGRQRYETIERFLNDRFALNEAGLHSLKILAGKKYSQLSDEIKEQFEDTRIRILQFRVVNEPRLDEDKEDRIKKEIFRRYNSGITPLGKDEIERASYIDDAISSYFYSSINKDDTLFDTLSSFFLPVSKTKCAKRDKINNLLMQIRTLISLPHIPIYSYAHSSSRPDVIRRYYYLKVSSNDPKSEFEKFVEIIEKLEVLETFLLEKSHFLARNKLFYEVAFWGISILTQEGMNLSRDEIDVMVNEIVFNSQQEGYWARIINNPSKEISMLFEVTGSHYYSSINNRYNYIANISNLLFNIDFSNRLKNPDSFKQIMSTNTDNNELRRYKLNKPVPETLTIEDIISDMQKDRFLVRPEYQRSEVKNIQKASYLMESILLGINIPPIFIFKRADKVKEVIDGQQRILTILGFLGKTYKDENGKISLSSKDSFKLAKLKILTELNGQTINTIEGIFVDKILEFPLDVIEIDYDSNPDFSQTDLFTRLNSKPYPIKENTFEMWNAYIDKDIIMRIREIADTYANIIFKAKDTRMKVEELITSLAYLDYRVSYTGVDLSHVLNVYKKNDHICARIMNKETVTRTLSDLSSKNPDLFIKSVNTVEAFAKKTLCLIDNDPNKLKTLFSHSRKRTQYKTDQNYYCLWAIMRNLSIEQIKAEKDRIFRSAAELFSRIQESSEAYTVQSFFNDINSFS